MTGETQADMEHCLKVLQAVHEILRAPDQPTLVRALVRGAHAALGFERVRLYVAGAEGLIHRRAAEGIGTEGGEPARALASTNLLGRAALTAPGVPCVWRVADLGDAEESPVGAPTCLVSVPLPVDGLAVVVADNPGSLTAVSSEMAASLASLTMVATCSAAHTDRSRLGVRFVSKVSHELRTPLTSVVAFTEMLLDGDAGALNEKQTRYVARVETGALMLLRVVQDLLELTHLEAAIRPPHEDQVTIRPFLEDIALNLTPQATARSIRLLVEAQEGLPALTTDSQRLQQAVTNLVDNAIKYGPQGGLVRLVAARGEEGLRLSVVDQGPGIHPDEQELVFEEFYRAYAGRSSLESKGAGLGLSIVRGIARNLGAGLQLDSAPGEGSTFSLVFPGQAER